MLCLEGKNGGGMKIMLHSFNYLRILLKEGKNKNLLLLIYLIIIYFPPILRIGGFSKHLNKEKEYYLLIIYSFFIIILSFICFIYLSFSSFSNFQTHYWQDWKCEFLIKIQTFLLEKYVYSLHKKLTHMSKNASSWISLKMERI